MPRPHDAMRDRVELEQLEGLCVVARRDLDIVTTLLQQRDEWPEEEHLGGVRDVDPDPHALTLAYLWISSAYMDTGHSRLFAQSSTAVASRRQPRNWG